MKKKAFTLVELIVVITILAILGTIAFISLSNYSKEARDSKRITDTSGLLSKINIEEVRGNTLDKLITNTRTATGQILGKTGSTFQTFGKANFKTLKEDEKNFEDPFKKGQHYPVAYTVGGSGKDAYKFVQIANVSEKENRNIIKGNYYTLSEQDNPSLFYSGSFYTEKPGSDLVYDLNGVVPKEPEIPKVGCANPKPSGDGIKNTTIGNPTEVNQVWVKDSPDCGFTCNDGYEGDNCEDLIIGITYSGNDIIVSDGVEKIVIADKNLGATKVADETICQTEGAVTCTSEYLGNHYQWGRNDTNFTGIGTNDWQTRNDNSWGGLNDTIDFTDTSTIGDGKLRQGPCPNGYHVPSTKEWKDLVDIWFASKKQVCNSRETFTCSWIGEANFLNFEKDLKITLSGARNGKLGVINGIGNFASFWSSSPRLDKTYHFGFLGNLIFPQHYEHTAHDPNGYPRVNGYAIRCFKN